MVGSRTTTALAGIAVSILVSALLYYYTNSLLFFLFVPFVPFLFRSRDGESVAGRAERPPVKTCPQCEYRTAGREYEYCPRDGSRLEPVGSDR